MHPSAHVTVTDVDALSVAAIGAGDLAVFALSIHHLPPALASRVFAEGTRVADKLVIVDLPRPPSTLHLLRLAQMLPLAVFPMPHDGIISSLRDTAGRRCWRWPTCRPGDRSQSTRRVAAIWPVAMASPAGRARRVAAMWPLRPLPQIAVATIRPRGDRERGGAG